ncbi:MAG: hypothetical protein Q7T04_07165, partial [Dehalococcoidia bacterium]|nr:hypothetical protein [Dehalococcoidia bacterium]
SAVDAFVNFDPSILEIMQIAQATTALPVELSNVYDNTAGTAGYSASKLTSPAPSGNFSVATITFRAKTTTTSTVISFSSTGERTTAAAYVGANYLDEMLTTAATVTYDVPVSLTGAPTTVNMLTDFTANIVINAGSAFADSAAVYLTFDPAYIQVNSIANGAFATVSASTYDNTLGQLTYTASNASALTGSITLATVHFQGKAVTAGTNITISFTDPRKTTVTNGGVVVPGVHGPEITGLEITPGGIINGTVTLQGSARPASGRTIPLTVKLFTVDAARTNATYFAGTGALSTYTPTTVNGGTNTVTFQVTGLAPGSYDISVIAGHTLMSVKKNVAVSGPTSINFGTLLEGNCNNDIQVTAVDFSILAGSYLKSTGVSGFDSRADFDYSGQVNSLDFSLLAANYLKSVQTVV